jgi:hypothetical protein
MQNFLMLNLVVRMVTARLCGGKGQIQITHWYFRVTQSFSDVWHLEVTTGSAWKFLSKSLLQLITL